jgi:tRNA threonylcarbamoyladenosine modification (KEOPS) complex  Pcc1 subunit
LGFSKITGMIFLIYTAEITIHEDAANVERLFLSQEQEFSNERAKYEVVRAKDSLTFKLSAADSTALRAVLNSVAKMLAVYEKTKSAVQK